MATITFKCPNCDGELLFQPDTQNYKCEYCNSVFSQEELEQLKPAKESQYIENTEEGQLITYHCPSCGASIVTDETTAATFCYYCHNPVVLEGRMQGDFLPDYIVPFEITKEKALEEFGKFIHKKKFVPKGFFAKDNLEKMTGVYFPYWLYHAKLDGNLQGVGRKIRVWRSGNTEYTETRVYNVSRAGTASFDYMPKNALKKANSKLALGVMPYEFGDMKAFSPGYLSGFMAEKRDIESTEVITEAKAEMEDCAEKLFKDSVKGYSSTSFENKHFQMKEDGFDYVLLPAWTLTYKGRDGKIYYFSMNGETGKVYGELPVYMPKLIGIAVAIFGACLLLGILIIGGLML